MPRVQLPASYGDLLPVNDISHTHEEPISQKKLTSLISMHIGESRAVNRARSAATARRVNHLLLVAVLGDVRKHEEW